VLDLSIVVCTRNRADLLDGLMATLAPQAVPARRHEIWIVDNSSSDATPERAAAWAAAHPHVHVVREERTGLANARNRGFREGRGRWVAYVDDDARVPAGWVERALSVIDAHSPELFGGPYRPFYLASRPAWFQDRYQSKTLGDVPRELGEGEFFSGTCIAIRRDVLERLGGFDTALGMAGGQLGYGEETDLQVRARRELGRPACFWYDPALVVEHLVPVEKMTMRWLLRSQFASGRDAWLVLGHAAGDRTALRWARIAFLGLLHPLAFAVRVFWAALFRDRRRFPDLRNHVFERSLRHVRAFGALWAEARSLSGRGGERGAASFGAA
jgi:glycosyltransferase involved in cell wall biosynthesis